MKKSVSLEMSTRYVVSTNDKEVEIISKEGYKYLIMTVVGYKEQDSIKISNVFLSFCKACNIDIASINCSTRFGKKFKDIFILADEQVDAIKERLPDFKQLLHNEMRDHIATSVVEDSLPLEKREIALQKFEHSKEAFRRIVMLANLLKEHFTGVISDEELGSLEDVQSQECLVMWNEDCQVYVVADKAFIKTSNVGTPITRIAIAKWVKILKILEDFNSEAMDEEQEIEVSVSNKDGKILRIIPLSEARRVLVASNLLKKIPLLIEGKEINAGQVTYKIKEDKTL